MDDIFYIIILITIIAVWNRLSVKKEKKNKKASPTQSFGEVFPDIKEWSKPNQQPQPTNIHTQSVGQSTIYGQPIKRNEAKHVFRMKKDRENWQKAFTEAPRSTTDIKTVTIPEEQTDSFLGDIRFQTPEDARKAFIYSEIFKRKYE
ncbi:MAG: hypothetical protein ACTTKN_10820 [Phocaeicola sp.]|uniref:hypothetical protein n=1 Tax=Phocaeicola sp. TaxID=2773926 RepID=UPI003FA18081